MQNKPSRLIPLFLAAGFLGLACQSVNAATTVPLWQPHDFSFKADAVPPNPFKVEFNAVVTGPNGTSFTLPGFFDGDGTWKIRVAPTIEGEWSVTTRSDLAVLNGQSAAFTCVKSNNPKIHGPLRVDPDHPHHFVYEDGTRFFMQGYEYNWLAALDMDKTDLPTLSKSLARIFHEAAASRRGSG